MFKKKGLNLAFCYISWQAQQSFCRRESICVPICVYAFNSHLCNEALHPFVAAEGPHGSDYAVQRVKLQRKPTDLEPFYNYSVIHLDLHTRTKKHIQPSHHSHAHTLFWRVRRARTQTFTQELCCRLAWSCTFPLLTLLRQGCSVPSLSWTGVGWGRSCKFLRKSC